MSYRRYEPITGHPITKNISTLGCSFTKKKRPHGSPVHKPRPSPSQEVELQARRDQFRLEELRQSHLLEKRQLPKRLKAEHKQQVAELRKAIRSKRTENDKERFRKVRV